MFAGEAWEVVCDSIPSAFKGCRKLTYLPTASRFILRMLLLMLPGDGCTVHYPSLCLLQAHRHGLWTVVWLLESANRRLGDEHVLLLNCTHHQPFARCSEGTNGHRACQLPNCCLGAGGRYNSATLDLWQQLS